jgi:hypothetical protein
MCDWMDRVIARVRGGPDIDKIEEETREAFVAIGREETLYRINTRRLERVEKELSSKVRSFAARVQLPNGEAPAT